MTLDILAWVYLASEWLIRLLMLPVVLRRRRPSSAMAWLLVVFSVPWFGLFLYLLVGQQRLGSFRAKRANEARRVVMKRGIALARENRHILTPDVRPAQHDFVAVARQLGESPILGGNDVELICDSDQNVSRLIADIDAAQHFMHMVMYIFSEDETGTRVADAIERAAQRGVQCRLALDAAGSRQMLKQMGPRLRTAGVEVVPLLKVNIVRFSLSRLDIRNHRKLIVIDGQIGWTGSQNIVNADYGQKRYGAWRDVMLRLRGPIVIPLHRVFMEDYYAETGSLLDDESLLPDPGEPGDTVAQLVPSGPHHQNRHLRDLYLAAIGEAEERIGITTPYFVPDEPVIAALRVAALRGVRVDLVLPQKGNHPVVQAAGRSYYRELVRAGVHVHLHTDGLLHAKTLTIDDALAMVGSSNFDVRSFEINYELNLLFYGPAITNQLRAQQDRYIEHSRPVLHEHVQRTSMVSGMACDAARLLSPLL